MSAPPAPTPSKRHVTGHKNGKAVYIYEDQFETSFIRDPVSGNGAVMAVPWTSAAVPADNTDDTDTKNRGDGQLHNDAGTTCRVVYFPPNSVSPMHRTQSLDYGVLVRGQIELELDGGEISSIKQGDVVVQRGTNHKWHNKTNEWAQAVFILVAASPIEGLAPEGHEVEIGE